MTSGIVPQSAIVTGLGEAVIEKNRDARLLSPGALLDASLGERLRFAAPRKATGAVRDQEAIVRATADGVVLQTADGFEALRCTGLPETLLASRSAGRPVGQADPVGPRPQPASRSSATSPCPTSPTISTGRRIMSRELSPAGDRMLSCSPG